MMRKGIVTAIAVLAMLFATTGIAAADGENLPVSPGNPALSETNESGTSGSKNIDVIVVTATRLETAKDEVGSSVTVITAEQIQQQGKISVLEVLRDVPALDVVQSGGPGTNAAVFIRGAKSEHTLVMMDGVEMNDPSQPGRSSDFASMTVDNIERIEIVRGPQSTLYGSDAMGGVINIITKKGTGKPSGFISWEGGSHNTFTERAEISGDTGKVNYAIGLSLLETDGISAAAGKDGNHEDDGYRNLSFSTRLGASPAKNFDADIVLRYIDDEADIDNSGGAGGDDPNNVQCLRQYLVRPQARLTLLDNLWEQKIGVSLNDIERTYRNDIDDDHPSDSDESTYDGRSLKFDWQHNLYVHESNTLTAGIETEKEEMSSRYSSESAWGPYSSTFAEETARTTGYYIQDQIRLIDAWFTTIGARMDDHDRFGKQTTFRLASSFLIKETSTRVKGSYGTGFKAPSLYQLFSEYGDEDLDPETSTGWDAGVEQMFCHDLLGLDITYFSNDFKDLIDFYSDPITYEGRYINVDEAESKGFETSLSARPTDELTLRACYTYTDTEDKETGEDLLRRPKNKASFNANYRFLGKGNVNLGILYVGKREDVYYDSSTWQSVRVCLDAYTLVNLAASYDLTEHMQISGRVDNVFDEDYEEVYGYGSPGLSAYAGIRVSL